MLILTRKRDEKIRIGEDIVITVCDLERGKVKLGIDAPRDVDVHREEIVLRIEAQAAADSAAKLKERVAARRESAATTT